MMDAESCIFCKIITGELPSTILYKDEFITCIPDLKPAAAVHLLVLTNKHYPTIESFPGDPSALLNAIHRCTLKMAEDYKLSDQGYRLIVNNGKGAGQTIAHFHLHILGGGPLPRFVHA